MAEDMWNFLDDVRSVAKEHKLPAHEEIAAYELLKMEMKSAIEDNIDENEENNTEFSANYIG